MPDFFISYTSADHTWAEWIAYVLEEEGFHAVIQAWDFRPGSNFVLEMQKAASEADRTIMVLSPDYLKSQFASPEWAAAFAHDPQGLARRLLPVMVRPCSPPGLLAPIVHVNLSGADEDAARDLLLDGVNAKRAEPARRPSFPGGAAKGSPKSFPGSSSSSAAYMPKLKRSATDAEKRRYVKAAFNVISTHFESGLTELSRQNVKVEGSFEPNTATEFIAEIFVRGTSACRCRVWLGGMFSSDGISYAEGQIYHGNNACNEMLSVEEDQGELYLSALMAMGFSQIERDLDVKRMNQEQAADYLWRRFLAPLVR
jgi:hypothetical protein